MTRIDDRIIRHLEALARLRLEEDERERLRGQLERIVAFVEGLAEADTSGVEPTGFLTHEDDSALRDDVVTPGLDRDDALRGAPDAVEGFFRVPRVLGGDEGGSA